MLTLLSGLRFILLSVIMYLVQNTCKFSKMVSGNYIWFGSVFSGIFILVLTVQRHSNFNLSCLFGVEVTLNMEAAISSETMLAPPHMKPYDVTFSMLQTDSDYCR
jgi:hypothetical protein